MSVSDFIIDKSILVIIDNDNSCHFENIVQSGIFNPDAIKANVHGYDSDDDYDD